MECSIDSLTCSWSKIDKKGKPFSKRFGHIWNILSVICIIVAWGSLVKSNGDTHTDNLSLVLSNAVLITVYYIKISVIRLSLQLHCNNVPNEFKAVAQHELFDQSSIQYLQMPLLKWKQFTNKIVNILLYQK